MVAVYRGSWPKHGVQNGCASLPAELCMTAKHRTKDMQREVAPSLHWTQNEGALSGNLATICPKFEICGLAHKLTGRENCTIDEIECALETYEAREPGTELAANCYSRLSPRRVRIRFRALSSMKIDVLINPWSFDFPRHERHLGGFKECFRLPSDSVACSP